MRYSGPRRWIALAVLSVLPLTACGRGKAADDDTGGAATITNIAGSPLKRVTLTADAAKRIGLTTAKVQMSAGGLTMPYGALLYDPDGRTWAFVKGEGLAFERKAVTIASITGDVATLTNGPPAGTQVVTLGATQLYGAEIGVGDE